MKVKIIVNGVTWKCININHVTIIWISVANLNNSETCDRIAFYPKKVVDAGVETYHIIIDDPTIVICNVGRLGRIGYIHPALRKFPNQRVSETKISK